MAKERLITVESWTGTGSTSYVAKKLADVLVIVNDDASPLTAKINGLDIVIKPVATDGVFQEEFEQFVRVDIVATGTYRILMKRWVS